MAQDSRGDEAPSYPVPLPYGALRWWSGCKVMTFQRNTQDFRQEKTTPPTSDRVAKPMPLQYGNMPQCFHACMNASDHARGPLWLLTSFGVPNQARIITYVGFVAAATNFRVNCHEQSCQLPRTIAPIVTAVCKTLAQRSFSVGSW